MRDDDVYAPILAELVQAERRLRERGLTGADALQEWIRERGGTDAADDAAVDVVGQAYQHFLPHRFKAQMGKFFTPRPIARLLVERADLQPGEHVLDPFAGSGGLLQLAQRYTPHVSGVERDPQLATFATDNLAPGGRVIAADAFTHDAHADVVVANPPFSLTVRDPEILRRFGVGDDAASSEWLFALALDRWVSPEGRAAVVLPHSVLTSRGHHRVRAALSCAFAVRGICELPEGVFRPFGGAQGRAVLLWLSRQEGPTLWARVTDPGYDVTRRTPRATASTELARLAHGQGWLTLPRGAWRPQTVASSGGTVRDVATRVSDRLHTTTPTPPQVAVLDLADVHPSTGYARPGAAVASSSLRGVRRCMAPGDVCVSRLRPERGLVTVAPPAPLPMVGSAEWVVLRTDSPHLLFHLLRTPAWREGLPEPVGQTRPRLRVDEVLDAPLTLPSPDACEAVEALSAELHDQRRRADDALAALQAAVDAYAAGQLTPEHLLERVQQLRRAEGQPVG